MSTATATSVTRSSKHKQYKWDIVWFNVIGFAILHLITLYGWYKIFTGQVKLATVVCMILLMYMSSFGVTMGGHRLFTHKAFKANAVVRAILLVMFTMAGQNCLWVWTRDHRQHHKYSDTDADPHNASRGFFFSHIGWLMVRKQPEVIARGKEIDMSDLEADPLIMFQKKYYKTWFTIFSIAIPTLIPYYFWNEDLWLSFLTCFITRLMTALNGAWCVNSVTHIYGTRPFTKDMLPTENVFVSALTSGEGWHNYHHSFPWDYKASELGQNFNLTGKLIEFCERHGWAWDLRYATPAMVRHRVLKQGDGTHHTYGNVKFNTNEDEDYERLKKDAEKVYNDENNTHISDKNNNKKYLDKQRKMKIIEGIYKLVE